MNRSPLLLAGLTLLWLSARPGWAGSKVAGPHEQEGDYVALLHGLGRTAVSRKRIEWALEKETAGAGRL